MEKMGSRSIVGCQKKVSKYGQAFSKDISSKLGNGDKICFWEDSWATNGPFCEIYPSI